MVPFKVTPYILISSKTTFVNESVKLLLKIKFELLTTN